MRGLMNDIDHSVDSQHFKYQNKENKFLSPKPLMKIFEFNCHKDLINEIPINFSKLPQRNLVLPF